MPVGAFVGASVGVAVGAAATYAYLHQQKRAAAPAALSPTVAVAPARHPALKHGLPIKERVRVFEDHVVGYDPATRNPIWVLEHLTKANAYGDAQRSKDFYEDLAIPERFRCRLASYERSQMDRGHMAPAMNHKATQKGMNDTFFLTNISPQIGPGFNRDYWARFEKFVKDTVKKSDDVYIATGPVFAPQVGPDGKMQSSHRWIGPPLQAVGVPTHFYKVVLCERTDLRSAEKRAAVAAFVMPNCPIPPDVPLTSFVVPLEYLETVTGIEFFPAALAPQHRSALDAAAAGWRRLGMAHRQALATAGRPQLADSMPGSDAALVPANKLPSVAELEATGLDAGPGQLRPQRTRGNGPVHLCEHVACRLPPERFWEKGQGSGGAGGVRGDPPRPAHRVPSPPR